MTTAVIPNLLGNILNRQVRIGEQLFCAEHADLCQVFHKRHAGFFVKNRAEVVRRHMKLHRDLSDAYVKHVVFIDK